MLSDRKRASNVSYLAYGDVAMNSGDRTLTGFDIDRERASHQILVWAGHRSHAVPGIECLGKDDSLIRQEWKGIQNLEFRIFRMAIIQEVEIQSIVEWL